MAEGNLDIKLRNIESGEVRELRTTTGGWLKATRTVGTWKRARILEEGDETYASFLWFYLAARHAGLEGTEGDDIGVERIEGFFDLWDIVDVSDEEGKPIEGGAPFDIGTSPLA